MSEEILGLIGERRKMKGKNNTVQKKTNRIIQKKILEKEKWLKSKCTEIEEQQQTKHSFNLHNKVREFTAWNGKYASYPLSNSEGKCINEPDES